jgi:DNA repair protein RadC
MAAVQIAPSFTPNLRERALAGEFEHLSAAELLAIVLGTGSPGESVAELAHRLLEQCGGIEGLSRLSPHGVRALRGVGVAKAARVAAALELGRRAALSAVSERHTVLASFDAVVAWARPRLAGLDHEEVWLLSMDGRNALKSARQIARGGQHGCALTTRDVLGPALRDAASAIVLIHNHPSGDPSPSLEDLCMTRTLTSACALVGVPLLDHVVVARGGASSLVDAAMAARASE